MSERRVSVIIPTLNEAENLPLLVPRVDAALAGVPHEILVVDDNSQDDTRRVCEELATQHPLRLIVRERPTNGLSGAVLEGMRQARGDTFVVMDADLQHPPEKIPELLAALDAGADFVIGSRYVPGASTAERWSVLRRVNSWVATALARPFAGRTHDPMSGFFALRRGTYDAADRLTPLGYKIALELMCKCRTGDVREVPIHFGTRARGQSKLTLTQQFRYLEHLSRLYDFTFPRAAPIAKFLIATAVSWIVAGTAYAMLVGLAGAGPFWAPVLAYPLAIGVIALFHLRYVRTQREFLVSPHPWRSFVVIALAEWLAVALVAAWLAARVADDHPVETFVLSFGAALVTRYALRKEFLMDVRGLRRELRRDELV